MTKMLFVIAALLGLGAAYAQQTSPATVNGGIYNSTPPTLSNLQRGVFQLDANGNLKVTSSGTPSGTQDINLKQIGGATVAQGHGTAAAALRVELPTDGTGVVGLNAGSNVIGHVILDTTSTTAVTQATAASLNATVSQAAAATGGYSYAHVPLGITTTVVKASAGTLHSITFNSAAAATNVTTLYDHASGAGTVIGIPAATAVTAPTTVLYDLAFGTGLTIITTTASGSDMTVTYK